MPVSLTVCLGTPKSPRTLSPTSQSSCPLSCYPEDINSLLGMSQPSSTWSNPVVSLLPQSHLNSQQHFPQLITPSFLKMLTASVFSQTSLPCVFQLLISCLFSVSLAGFSSFRVQNVGLPWRSAFPSLSYHLESLPGWVILPSTMA